MTQQRFGAPPALLETNTFRYLQRVADTLNLLPPLSNFSLVSPESVVTATRGTLGVNTNSNASVLWVKQTGSGTTGWRAIA